MIWINVKRLEEHLINGEVTDRLAFTYLLCHLTAFSVTSHLTEDEDPLWSVWVHLFLSLGTMLWGVHRTFAINEQGDNRDYFKRFLSLSFVAGLRSLLMVAFFFVFLDMLIDWRDSSFFQDELNKAVMELVSYACFLGLFYFMLLRSFRRVNGGADS